MFINMGNPNFNPAQAQKNFRESFMTTAEKKSLDEKKKKIDILFQKLKAEQEAKKKAMEEKKNQEYEFAARNTQEIIKKARQELVEQAEALRQEEVKFRKMLRKEHLKILENNRDMVEGMNAKEVDLINHTIYVKEFYDKMNNLYIKDYEYKIKDLENINSEFAVKRAQYEIYKTMEKPKEEVKITMDPSKIDPFKKKNEKGTYNKLGNVSTPTQSSSGGGAIGGIAISVGFLTLIAGGYMVNQ